jgi:excisionase family DNA binding protein
MTMQEYMTVTAAATELGLTPDAVRRRLERGIMTGIRVHARLWVIPRAEVDRWRPQGRLRPGPKPKAES